MGISIWCEIVCDECSRQAEGRFVSNGRIPVREMRKASVKDHKFHYKNGEMYCDRCFKNTGDDYDTP